MIATTLTEQGIAKMAGHYHEVILYKPFFVTFSAQIGAKVQMIGHQSELPIPQSRPEPGLTYVGVRNPSRVPPLPPTTTTAAIYRNGYTTSRLQKEVMKL